ncbi:MAG: type II toxin-antitoxin system Phd/YefM family antitoxin [Deltaproteobacteria bacterium]|nr:type II toxin-antitoxin system Phd/YefM family antitoxin [Deltaproteobacteria bacterium]
MSVKFSEDIVPISDLKANPAKIVRHVTEEHRPVLLTSRGRGVAVVQNLQDFESSEEERMFMRAVVKGMVDLEEGREKPLRQVKKELGLK